MRIYVALKEEQRLTAKYAALPRSIQAALAKKGEQLRQMLRRYVIDRKLSGQVLNRKTGRLQRNTRATMTVTKTTLRIVLGTVSRYGRIHEKGGVIPAHTIEPKRAKVLSWTKYGERQFARQVNLPPVSMPKRPFLAPSLRENQKKMSLALKAAIVENLRK